MLQYDHRLKPRARSLRRNLTDAELHLWHRLRRKQILGVQFYRQKPLGQYIVDFYAPAAKLILELDGGQHGENGQVKYDQLRTEYLEQRGLRVLRFDDREVLLQTDSVLEAIFQALKKSLLTSLYKGRNWKTCRCVQVSGRESLILNPLNSTMTRLFKPPFSMIVAISQDRDMGGRPGLARHALQAQYFLPSTWTERDALSA